MVSMHILDKLESDILIINSKRNSIAANWHLLKKLNYTKQHKRENLDLLVQPILNEGWLEGLDHKKYLMLTFQTRSGDEMKAWAELGRDEEEKDLFWIVVKRWQDESFTLGEMEQILDLMPYEIWAEDSEGKYCFANDYTINELRSIWDNSMTKEHFYGNTFRTMWQPKIGSMNMEKTYEQLRAGKTVNIAKNAEIGKNNYSYVLAKIPERDEQGKLEKVFCIKDSQLHGDFVEESLIQTYRSYWMPNGVSEDIKPIKNDKNQHIPFIMGFLALGLCEYNAEKERLQVILSIGNMRSDLYEVESLHISKALYEKMIQDQQPGMENELNDQLNKQLKVSSIIANGRKLYQYPAVDAKSSRRLLITLSLRNALHDAVNARNIKQIDRNISAIVDNLFLLKQVQEEADLIKKGWRQLENIQDTAICAYSMYNVEKHKPIVNLGWREILGWIGNEDVEMEHKVFSEEDRQDILQKLRKIVAGEEIGENVTQFKAKDGSYRWIRWKAKYNKSCTSIVMCGIDVSEQVEELEREKAYKKALEVEKNKCEFLANMSHELKTPLNIICSVIQLADNTLKCRQDQMKMESVQRSIKIIKQNIYRLLRLINNVVDISSIEGGKYSLHKQNCNLVEVVEDITMSVVEYVKEEKLKIIFDTEEEDIETACDIEKIERIILNLISNAVKYSRENSEIIVRTYQEGNNAMIQVSDNGEGIPEEKIPIIFERFVQADQSFTRKCEGSGIGLALVRSLVELHGGTIQLSSKVGQGTTFTISLPISRVQQDENTEKEIRGSKADQRIERCNIEFSDIYSIQNK